MDKQALETWGPGTIEERIHRLRRVILVHSIIYYRLNSNIIEDWKFDDWAKELAQLQRINPEESKRVLYHQKAFEGFSGETGFDLPLYDKRSTTRAICLLRDHKKLQTQ